MKKLFAVLVLVFVTCLVGCREAKEGAEAISEKVTGQKDIEEGKRIEEKAKSLINKHNQDQLDALKKLEK